MKARTHSAEDGWSIGVMKKCKVCGQPFWVRDGKWGYTLNAGGSGTKKYYFCKWSHLRAWEKLHRPEKKPKEGDWEF